MRGRDVPSRAPRGVMSERASSSLYDRSFDRDSCGFGLIANLDDRPSHWVVETAITALARLTHRGAVAADGKTAWFDEMLWNETYGTCRGTGVLVLTC